MNRMVTKGYQKGVYEWVTLGIRRGSTGGGTRINGFNMNVLWGGVGSCCMVPSETSTNCDKE